MKKILNYIPKMNIFETEDAIKFCKDSFERKLSKALNLRRVTAPLFVIRESGMQDDLNGTERPVSFPVKALDDQEFEIVHSLAKWKRFALAKYSFSQGAGIYTDMNAIRADEDNLDNIHSVYVDQWDWEKVISADDRNLNHLKNTVSAIYRSIKKTEDELVSEYPSLDSFLPDKITFIHTEELLKKYPNTTSKERENLIAKEFGAVFIIGIGGKLSDGIIHDGRAPDYDDWSTKNCDGYYGLNGDIIVWNPLLEQSFELSSMGIRVDKSALLLQLNERGANKRLQYEWHQMLVDGKLPLTIGGGIGQSRLCMLLLQKAHIGEVQVGIWPLETVKYCKENRIHLL